MKKIALLLTATSLFFSFSAEAGERSGKFEGKRLSGSYERNWNRESGTGSSSRTTTNLNGQTATTKKSYTKNDDGTYSMTGTREGFRNNSQTMSNTITKTEDGYTSNKTITGQSGKSVTTSRTYSRGGNE